MELKVKDYSAGDVMHIIREWTELNQDKFAKTLGKSKSTIQSYETGRRKYTLDTLIAILAYNL